MAGSSGIYCFLLWVNKEHNRWLLDWVLGKKAQTSLYLCKSFLCLRRANMRGWVIALLCCGMLGSDERRVPVVKRAEFFHRWREGKTLTEKWLRSPATLMLATAQRWPGSPRGRAHSSTHWVTQILGKWLFSAANFGVLCWNSQFCKYWFCWLCVTCCAWTERQQK